MQTRHNLKVLAGAFVEKLVPTEHVMNVPLAKNGKREFCHCCLFGGGVKLWVSVNLLETILIVTDGI